MRRQIFFWILLDKGLLLVEKEFMAFSSAGSEHLPYKQRVGGSNPSTPTREVKSMTKPLYRVAFVVSVGMGVYSQIPTDTAKVPYEVRLCH